MGSNWVDEIINNEKGLREKCRTPRVIEDDNAYLDDLNQWLESLKNAFDNNKKIDKKYAETISDYKDKITEIFTSYMKGEIGQAYKTVVELLEDIRCKGQELAISSVQKSIAFNNAESVLEGKELSGRIEFFRARESDRYKIFQREEMLHVPFDMRHKISSGRFSIPGLPCLYLGSSSYCCWLELRNPPDHQFNVSPVEIDLSCRILNLTVNLDLFEKIAEYAAEDGKANEKVIEALKLWILTYATSYKVDGDNRSFKIEYVLSQLLMLASVECNLGGVAYFSKQVEDDRFAQGIAANLALFAKYNGEKRFSEICKTIKLSPSFNYSMFKQLKADATYKINGERIKIDNRLGQMGIEEINRVIEYRSTKFYQFDKYMFAYSYYKRKAAPIDDLNNK